LWFTHLQNFNIDFVLLLDFVKKISSLRFCLPAGR
jgi:hypothetical protein